MSFLIVIPARLESTRLPRKLLLADTGQALLRHTIETARSATDGEQVYVACDDRSLADAAESAGANVVMVTEYCESGTARIQKALSQLPDAEVIVNLQADEPEMPAEWITLCANGLLEDRSAAIATLAIPIAEGDQAVSDTSRVKVVMDHAGHAMYFSRLPIPYVRTGGKSPTPRAFGHLGLYAYRRVFLQSYAELPSSPLEDAECLEQLRFLQAGVKVKVIIPENSHVDVRGIDTEDDYRSFVARCHARRQ